MKYPTLSQGKKTKKRVTEIQNHSFVFPNSLLLFVCLHGKFQRMDIESKNLLQVFYSLLISEEVWLGSFHTGIN